MVLGAQEAPLGVRARQLLSKVFVAAYPYAHAACELTSLGYQAAYLLGAAPCHRPVLHALGTQLARVSANDLVGAVGWGGLGGQGSCRGMTV